MEIENLCEFYLPPMPDIQHKEFCSLKKRWGKCEYKGKGKNKCPDYQDWEDPIKETK